MGLGVNINPIAFLVVQANNVKLLPVCHSSAVDKLLDYMPDAIEKVNNLINKQMQIKKEEKCKDQNNSKESKTEKVSNPSSKIKPRRNKARNSEVYEYEYNEVPSDAEVESAEDILEDYDD